jgi:hypothetical protein
VTGSSNAAFALSHDTIDDVTGVVDSSSQDERTISHVGLKSFVGNIAYGNSGGVFGILGGTRSASTETISGLLAYGNAGMNNGEMISWWYPDNVTLENITLIGDINHPKYIGIGTQTKLRRTTIKNVKIEGLRIGLRIPEYYGPNVVEDAYLNNLVNMHYALGTTNKGANTTIKGKIRYGQLPGNPQQYKIEFALNVRDVSWKNYWNRQYVPFNIVYAPEGETPMKLYLSREQRPDFVIKIGDQKGKSNARLIKEGHRPVGATLIPSGATRMAKMKNVSGIASEE